MRMVYEFFLSFTIFLFVCLFFVFLESWGICFLSLGFHIPAGITALHQEKSPKLFWQRIGMCVSVCVYPCVYVWFSIFLCKDQLTPSKHPTDWRQYFPSQQYPWMDVLKIGLEGLAATRSPTQLACSLQRSKRVLGLLFEKRPAAGTLLMEGQTRIWWGSNWEPRSPSPCSRGEFPYCHSPAVTPLSGGRGSSKSSVL